MSKFKQQEEQYNKEINILIKEKNRLKGELDQIQNDKIHYKQKADLLSFNRAVNKEKKINRDLNLVISDLATLEAKLKKLKREEKQEKDRLERKRKREEKQRQTRKQMDDVLWYMQQGKNRSEAAKLVGIKESKILNWHNEGKLGTNENTIYFYDEVTKIEKDQKEKAKKERSEQLNQERKQKKIKRDILYDLMQDVLYHMGNGNTMEQAAQIVGIKISKVKEWYEKGLNNENKDYRQFYEKVNEIEIVQKSSLTDGGSIVNMAEIINDNFRVNCESSVVVSQSNSIAKVNYCQNCGRKISDDNSKYCSSCGSSLIEIKRSYSGGSNYGSKSKTTVSTNYFGKCCSGLMVMFFIIAILMVIL